MSHPTCSPDEMQECDIQQLLNHAFSIVCDLVIEDKLSKELACDITAQEPEVFDQMLEEYKKARQESCACHCDDCDCGCDAADK